MSTLYHHPDGHSIDFADNTLTVVASDGVAVSIPMGADGLRRMWERLDSCFTEGDTAEQAGHALGQICLDATVAHNSQAEDVVTLTRALLDLQRLPHPDRACAGFAVALLATIERGLNHA